MRLIQNYNPAATAEFEKRKADLQARARLGFWRYWLTKMPGATTCR